MTHTNPQLNAALQRAMNPFRPNTKQAYLRQFKLFLAYSIKNKVQNVLCVFNLLMFLELLYQSHMSPRNIINHVTAIKSMLKLLLLPFTWVDHTLISNYLRSITINTRVHIRHKGIFTLQQIVNISTILNSFKYQHHFRTAYLLSFMAFLRISNLVPAAVKKADPQRQLTWQDVKFTAQGAIITLKWAKNMQEGYIRKCRFQP